MDSMGALASGLAHDLNKALSPILMGIQLISRKTKDPETREMLRVMETSTYRGADMVRQVLTFAGGHGGERELLNVARLIREMESIVLQSLPNSIKTSAMVPSDLWPVIGNSTQLHQVLLNLCINSRDAMQQGGEITLVADNVDLSLQEAKDIPEATPGQYVMLLVSDNGVGIAPEILPRIFEPFFTTKGPDKGSGLGLSTIARIVRNHGGFVSVKSELGIGTTFEIYLPRASDSGAAKALPESSNLPAPGRGELILIIDADQSVREMVSPALTEHGYRILSAANGAEGLTLFNEYVQEVRLVLTDQAGPRPGGTSLLAAIRSRRPNLPIVVMSSETESIDRTGVSQFLPKPFRLEQLLNSVARALDPTIGPPSIA
jgi:CheY-like chemotaxis protein